MILVRLGMLLLAANVLGCSARNLADVIKENGPSRVLGSLTVTPIEFRTLENGTIEAERGRLTVPVRRDREGSSQLSIHYVRFPARTPTPAAPIVYLAGGPGGSGTASAAGDRFWLFDALREVADVIALDQRGTWNADPYMVCPGEWDFPLDEPMTVDALTAAIEPWVTQCHQHWSEQGVDLDAFNTRESAADLEDLRVALGAKRLNLWAISYGTHLALEFARSFPESVDRLVLAGTEGPDHTLKSAGAIEAALERVDELFAQRGMAPITLRARQVIERLETTVTATARDAHTRSEVAVSFGVLDAQRTIFGGAGERSDLSELSEGLDLTLKGDYGPAAQAIYDWRTGNRGLAMSMAMDCSSWASEERLRQIDAEAATSFLGDAANLLVRAQCRSWPGARLADGYHEAVTSEAPTLFISGALDVRTPLENALEVSEGFPNSWHLVVRDGGHDDDLLIATPEIGEAIRRFFAGHLPETKRRDIWIDRPNG
ncbi:MAG: alpha/beta fold hydrolase [Gemmatimonadetes bacterium]|nr:alpha/beta fold hydrolase [Gemmatimonadota bacterium]